MYSYLLNYWFPGLLTCIFECFRSKTIRFDTFHPEIFGPPRRSSAKQNVAKRMEYISSELKQVEELITTLDKKQDTHRETLEKYQHMFQQAQLKASLSQPKA
uniref:probable prefoldin subunit 6 n=1 Tax=Osmia lignaria TaxID=473952 RepID=UPI00147865FF|nr:probable prefoldin subunit 6 [Osmia lignaria]